MHRILHITDLHFGWAGSSQSEINDRKVCLDALLEKLRVLEPDWKPTVVCITGDVAWRGSESDYVAARGWLDKLLDACGLGWGEVVVCAGNHDVIRDAAIRISRPGSAKEADQVLALPITPYLEGPFKNFIQFCTDAKIAPLTINENESYLVGGRICKGIHFVVLNTSWFCKDAEDRSNLWIGLPHLKSLQGSDHLTENPSNDRLTVALLHHPKEWLNQEEINSYGTRPNSWDYIAHRCHIMLTGHTHGEVRGMDCIADRALHAAGGAAYAGASHFNSFRLIRIRGDQVEDRSFEYDPRSASDNWKSQPVRSRPLGNIPPRSEVEQTPSTTLSTVSLRKACLSEAAAILNRKSRLLRGVGQLPAISKRLVSLRVSDQKERFDAEGKLVRESDTECSVPFYEAARESRRTLLLGDLGTGKSTLAAQLVIETITSSETAVAILIPVKILNLRGQFTKRELLTSIDEYIRAEVDLSVSDFTLESILGQGIEVLTVFDGLDELARDIASRLLWQAASLVEQWATIQVVCTARPIELVGASFADWRVVCTIALDDTEKTDFLKNELLADGVGKDDVDEDALLLLQTLKNSPSLDAIANSPLAIRLIFPKLRSLNVSSSLTLGDLLYEMLIEHLDGWQKRDDKAPEYRYLQEMLPTAEDKAAFFSVLAYRVCQGERLSRDQAKIILVERANKIVGCKQQLLAEEVLNYFKWLGLISVSDVIDFPLQPFAEICAALGVAELWHDASGDFAQVQPSAWRVVSFAAAIARRRGWLDALRAAFSNAIENWVGVEGYLPVVCYIVAESADRILAETAVRSIDELGYRPLFFLGNERKESVRNIAKTLALAGDIGFDWFYRDYLDPRYPIPMAGEVFVLEVFTEYSNFVRTTLSRSQREKLTALVEPYKATGEGQFYGVLTVLSVVVPDAFSSRDRLWFQSMALGHWLFSKWVENEFRRIHKDDRFKEELESVISYRLVENATAARLWLEWNENAVLPYDLIRLALNLVAKAESSADAKEIIKQCLCRLGEERWFQFVRWSLVVEESATAIGAAKILFDRGERRLSILGDVAMVKMHDGGYIPDAEHILKLLIDGDGERGIRWLASRIANSNEFHGAHAGWWRILLGRIDILKDGPELLASCIHTLGQFTIPRYPEVREGFMRILNGSNGKQFREALREELKSLDPSSRRGAAIVLATSDPGSESEALFVAVKIRAQGFGADWYEWESFCMTLTFGPSVLAFLKSKLALLEPQSRAMALILLAKGGIGLDSGQNKELVEVLLTVGNWHLIREAAEFQFFTTEGVFEDVKNYLNLPESDKARYAADVLLKYYSEHLSANDKAKCIALRGNSLATHWELMRYLRQMIESSVFAGELLKASEEIVDVGGKMPLLGVVAKAIINDASWKDVLWRLLCDDSDYATSMELEPRGMALLEFGLSFPCYRANIGRAAIECLSDARLKRNSRNDVCHWLALLADEFNGLAADEIQGAIVRGKSIGYSATTSLIARLGSVPMEFSCDQARRRVPELLPRNPQGGRTTESLIEQLVEFCRDSGSFHPELLGAIRECLFLEPLNNPDLLSISSSGKAGILASTLLRFVYGQSPDLGNTIAVFDIRSRGYLEGAEREQTHRLMRAWMMLKEAIIEDDGKAKNDYLLALDRALIESSLWKLRLAREVLEVRGSLTCETIPFVFSEYADHPSYLHGDIFRLLSYWLSGEVDEGTRCALIAAAGAAIIKLDESPWCPKSGELPNPWASLIFPTLIWAYGGGNSVATEAVFLRGIRAILDEVSGSRGARRVDLVQLFGDLEPLLAQAPSSQIRSVIQRGLNSDEPTISAFCRLIDSIGNKC